MPLVDPAGASYYIEVVLNALAHIRNKIAYVLL